MDIDCRFQAQEFSLSVENSSRLHELLVDHSTAAYSTLEYPKTSQNSHLLQKSLTENVQRILTVGRETLIPTSLLQHKDQIGDDFYTWPGKAMPHVQALNPFDHYTASSIKPFLDAFIARVNSVFFFFDEQALEQRFEILSEVSSSTLNSNMSELCLVLALGAQMSNGGNDDQTIMWYENGRRYLDDENWRNELWIMRATALISLYHLGERPDTSRHYLGELFREHGFCSG